MVCSKLLMFEACPNLCLKFVPPISRARITSRLPSGQILCDSIALVVRPIRCSGDDCKRRWRLSEANTGDRGLKMQRYLAAIGVPITVPITSPETTISTRRFCCRPSAVSFEATG